MPKKYYAILEFETKEAFDKHIKDIYNEGYKDGCHKGFVDALARLIYIFENEFEDEDIASAEALQRNIGISRWKKQQKRDQAMKALAVHEFEETLTK